MLLPKYLLSVVKYRNQAKNFRTHNEQNEQPVSLGKVMRNVVKESKKLKKVRPHGKFNTFFFNSFVDIRNRRLCTKFALDSFRNIRGV